MRYSHTASTKQWAVSQEVIKKIDVSAIESDGSEVSSAGLGPKFPHGLFVAMSNGRVFHYYAWEDLAGTELRR